MHPAMQRRRHRLMVRRTTKRHGQRQGVATFLVALFAVFVVVMVGSVAGSVGAGLAAYNYFAQGLPSPQILEGINLPQSTLIYDRTGKVLLARFECQNRESVTFADVPPMIVEATVSIEDRTFWSNPGVDFAGAVRAMLANLRAKAIVQGASTITQQVIKYAGSIKAAEAQATPTPNPSASQPATTTATDADVCKPPDLNFLSGRSLVTKIKENILAMQVSNAYPGRAGKEKILEAYLNLIFYGNGSYGIKAAAANYFGITDLKQLTLSQAAFLAGIPQLPSAYDPYQSPEGAVPAIARRNEVLRRMFEDGYITKAQREAAVATTWAQMHPSRVTSVLKEPQFSFRVENEAERILSKMGVPSPAQAVRTGGYRITTTLDYGLQQAAKAEVTRWVRILAPKNVHNSAMVAIDSATGEIVAYVGSVDYYNRKDPRVQGQFDVAGLGRRQIGSAFKPFAYTSAFQARKANVATMLVDATTNFGGNYVPTNADLKEHGPLLAADALRYSLNVPSVQMQYLVSPDVTARFAEAAGIASHDYLMGLYPGLTLALGSVPVNLTQATQGYETFANQGTAHPATTILEIRDRNGRLVYSLDQNGPDALHPTTAAEAYLTHWILESNTDPKRNLFWGPTAVLYGPGGVRRHAAVKTGTTNDFKDVSTFGYLPGSLVVGVWMGNNNQQPMANNLFAAYGPLYLWHEFMNIAINRGWDWNDKKVVPLTDFPKPDGVTMTSVCRWTGLAPSSSCPTTISVPFLDGTQPGADNSWVNGCLDLVKFVNDQGRPATWAKAAKIWADRYVNGGKVAIKDPDPATAKHQLPITPLPGERGWPAICGQKLATPSPSPSGSGGPGACKGNPHDCTPVPSFSLPLNGSPTADVGTIPIPVALFAAPALAGLLAYAGRLRRTMRRGRTATTTPATKTPPRPG
jgi:membrane peptidoglycan carboxypeptidase